MSTEIKYPENRKIIDCMKKEVDGAVGKGTWDKITSECCPTSSMDNKALSAATCYMLEKLDALEREKGKAAFVKVRHGLTKEDFRWAREKFLKYNDIDQFAEAILQEQLENLKRLKDNRESFYGQAISEQVYQFALSVPDLFYGKRYGNKILATAIPFHAHEYLNAESDREKRYFMCHCQFARESILTDRTVSDTMCSCSLGHNLMFWETVLDTELEGEVLHSALRGDDHCRFAIFLPDELIHKYTADDSNIVISNYYNYYSIFAQSGIIHFHEGNVSWITPKEGEKGPSLAFRVHLNAETAEKEMQSLIAGIRKKIVPKRWIITPDATPENIVEMMERNGFRNLSADAAAPEPGMILDKADFRMQKFANESILCRRIETREDFGKWIDIVNSELNGWDMIDAEHYFAWVENENIRVYLGEKDKKAVAACATIQNGSVGSLEFVAVLKEYRRQKAATVVCQTALEDLFARQVEKVTLSSCGESFSLYRKMGFRRCFDDMIMEYDSSLF